MKFLHDAKYTFSSVDSNWLNRLKSTTRVPKFMNSWCTLILTARKYLQKLKRCLPNYDRSVRKMVLMMTMMMDQAALNSIREELLGKNIYTIFIFLFNILFYLLYSSEIYITVTLDQLYLDRKNAKIFAQRKAYKRAELRVR